MLIALDSFYLRFENGAVFGHRGFNVTRSSLFKRALQHETNSNLDSTMKTIQLLATIALMFASTAAVNAQTLHAQMFEKFGTIAQSMNTPLCNEHIEKTAELPVKFIGLLDEAGISDSKVIPLGKVEKGKNVILLYFVAEYTDEGELRFFNLHAATLNKKTGEKIAAKKYLLAGGTVSGSMYNGSLKLKEKGLLVVSQNEVEIATDKETVVVKEYEFGKELEYLRTID
jgi:hypothetical protein